MFQKNSQLPTLGMSPQRLPCIMWNDKLPSHFGDPSYRYEGFFILIDTACSQFKVFSIGTSEPLVKHVLSTQQENFVKQQHAFSEVNYFLEYKVRQEKSWLCDSSSKVMGRSFLVHLCKNIWHSCPFPSTGLGSSLTLLRLAPPQESNLGGVEIFASPLFETKIPLCSVQRTFESNMFLFIHTLVDLNSSHFGE